MDKMRFRVLNYGISRFLRILKPLRSRRFAGTRFTFSSTAKTLTIPAKVRSIGDRAFQSLGGGPTDVTVVEILSDALANPSPGSPCPSPCPLGNNLFQGVSIGSFTGGSFTTGIRVIRLPQAVYDSYTKAQLQAIFGSGFTNYRKPDGTAYNFTGKS